MNGFLVYFFPALFFSSLSNSLPFKLNRVLLELRHCRTNWKWNHFHSWTLPLSSLWCLKIDCWVIIVSSIKMPRVKWIILRLFITSGNTIYETLCNWMSMQIALGVTLMLRALTENFRLLPLTPKYFERSRLLPFTLYRKFYATKLYPSVKEEKSFKWLSCLNFLFHILCF